MSSAKLMAVNVRYSLIASLTRASASCQQRTSAFWANTTGKRVILLNEHTYPLSVLRGATVSEQLYTMHIT